MNINHQIFITNKSDLLKSIFISCFISILGLNAGAQDEKMDPAVYASWNRIMDVKITAMGDFVMYRLQPGHGDSQIEIHDVKNSKNIQFNRSEKPSFNFTGTHAIFNTKPSKKLLKDLRRKKTQKKDLPGDTLVIYNLHSQKIVKIPHVKSHRIPEKWGDYIAYQLDPEEKQDSIDKANRVKKESSKNGSKLIVRNLQSGKEDTFQYVKSYTLAEKRPILEYYSTGLDSTFPGGVYHYDVEMNKLSSIKSTNDEVKNLSLSINGDQSAFLINHDSIPEPNISYNLYHWKQGMDEAEIVANHTAAFMPDDWKISSDKELSWSDDSNRLLFGIRPDLPVQDTNLLEEEIVEVEVWNYKDQQLYTQQENNLTRDKRKTYDVLYYPERNSFVLISDEELNETRLPHELKGQFGIVYTESPYQKYISWLGFAYKDMYRVDLESGERKLIGNKVHGNVQISPEGKFFYWYSPSDSMWMFYNVLNEVLTSTGSNLDTKFFNELNDVPNHPNPYGLAGWSSEDKSVIIYDRYDLWEINPLNPNDAVRLTAGRDQHKVHRVIDLDPDEQSLLLDEDVLLHVFDDKEKTSGYAWRKGNNGEIETVFHGPFSYTNRVRKASESNIIVFTKESFELFPNLILSDLIFSDPKTISNANPQQERFGWGEIDLFQWIDLNGDSLQGLIVTPPDFDRNKKYPLLVNFYEKSSNGLYRHRAPEAHRSTINYTYYTNNGYVIFNPDIYYSDGYPGESCYNAVLSGVHALLAEGFIDKERIGLQGHSWGGYQIAHLLTKTNMFRCAESGAPVVNMISAYGGIRWGSGMSRMFQYEHTQSRIGGTLWDLPELYIENSPIFNMDLVQTPVLILHNDGDTAVPWYQGIEYFVALRRLGKPAWLLNYNGEPHWPLKWQNRLDFNIRMQQFFDYYLKDAPLPKWMKDGVPALEKGIHQGYELIKN